MGSVRSLVEYTYPCTFRSGRRVQQRFPQQTSCQAHSQSNEREVDCSNGKMSVLFLLREIYQYKTLQDQRVEKMIDTGKSAEWNRSGLVFYFAGIIHHLTSRLPPYFIAEIHYLT